MLTEGSRLPRAPIIGLLNSDDLYLPDALSRVLAHSDAGMTVRSVGGDA